MSRRDSLWGILSLTLEIIAASALVVFVWFCWAEMSVTAGSAAKTLLHFQPANNWLTIEAEGMRPMAWREGMMIWPRGTEILGAGLWSNNSDLRVDAKEGDAAELRFDMLTPGFYRILAVMTKAPDHGVVDIEINGKSGASAIDLHASTTMPSGPIDLGLHPLEVGAHTVKIALARTQASENDEGRKKAAFAFDRLILRTEKAR